MEVLEPVWIYLCELIEISGFTRRAQFTVFLRPRAISSILSNSPKDSIFIDKMSLSIANLISSSDLATPEKTILLLSAPAKRHLFSSFPETTSNPDPRSDNSLSICRFELAFTA